MLFRINIESLYSSIECKELELIETKASLKVAQDLEHEGTEKLKKAKNTISLLLRKR